MTAAERWEAALTGWGLPQAVLDAFDGDPWALTPEDLEASRRSDPPRSSPADVAALEALPRGGSVLDVGCGAGGASAALRRAARVVTGVDHRPAMLARFAEVTAQRPTLLKRWAGDAPEVRTVEGRWPDVAGDVGPADVVVCHNVLYDVTRDVAAFVAALTDHAHRTVVMALTEKHPLSWLSPYMEQLHGITRPGNPTVDDAADLVAEVTGTMPTILRWIVHLDPPEDIAAFERMVARRCAVGEDRLHDVGLALHRTPPPEHTRVAALVWPGTA